MPNRLRLRLPRLPEVISLPLTNLGFSAYRLDCWEGFSIIGYSDGSGGEIKMGRYMVIWGYDDATYQLTL